MYQLEFSRLLIKIVTGFSLLENLVKDNKNLVFFSFQSQFFNLKIELIILKMIFVLEYQSRRTSFSKNNFNFIVVYQILFSKNPLSLFIRLQKFIENHMIQYGISQPLSH